MAARVCVLIGELLMKLKKLIFISSFALLTSPASYAETNTSLSPVVVTATRTAETGDETISPMVVISREEIERHAGANIEDIIRMETGIEISRNGGQGQTTSIFIRGTDSNHTLVMIDGVKMNPGTIGGASIQNISIDMIERIEIVKGPRSTLYGSDAIGGVINIITKRRDTDGDSYQVGISVGPYSTQKMNLSANNKQGDKAAGINFSATSSDGFSTKTTSTVERGFDNINLHVYGQKKMGDANVQVSHWQSEGTTEYLSFGLASIDQDYVNATTTVQLENQPTDTWSSTLKLSRIQDKIDQNQGADFANTSRYTLDWQNDTQLNDNNLLSAGLYISEEATTASSFGTNFDIDTSINALFLQNIFNAKQHKLISGVRFTDHETFGNETTWNIEYGYTVDKNLRFSVASNTGFRAPDSSDRFGFGGTPNLLPEVSKNIEFGIRYRPAKNHSISFDVYKNKITNLIEYDTGTSTNQNIGLAEITGNELAYKYSGEHWRVKASGIEQAPENALTNAPLLRRAKHTYSLSLGYTTTDFDINVNTYYSGKRQDFGPVTLDEYTLVQLSAQYRVSDSLNINMRIENLTDENYFLANGFNTHDRGVYLELNYKID